MSKYFYDTEFLEGKQSKTFLGIKYGETKPTIDLISIGIVSGDGREYYAVSKDFNLKEAWNRCEWKEHINQHPPRDYVKEHWIRDNVLRPIFNELLVEEGLKNGIGSGIFLSLEGQRGELMTCAELFPMSYKGLKRLIEKYGKSNKQIANEVKEFCPVKRDFSHEGHTLYYSELKHPEFYGYYSAYDHVCLCWLFGKMIDLPQGFPMYTKDLKQVLDEKAAVYEDRWMSGSEPFEWRLDAIESIAGYPEQSNEHHSLADAKFNRDLHKFIETL